jgi:hypothetical protein
MLVSGLGGIAVCIVVFKYGLVPPAEDDPIELTHRRLFATHLAHAFAAVAFALTAVLAAMVLIVGPAPRSSASEPIDVHAVAQRLDGVEATVERISETLDTSVQRLERSAAAAARR